MNLLDSGSQPDSEFKIRPDPDIGYGFRYPNLIVYKIGNSLQPRYNVELGFVTEMEGFCYDKGGDLYIAVNDSI